MAKLGQLKDVQSRTGTRDSHAVILTVKDIQVGDIQIKENVRTEYTGIDELKESIRQHGLLQPIMVYINNNEYFVKTGHRRFYAYKELSQEEPERFHRIRCIISDAKNIAIIQLVENLQRVDLSQIDLVNALAALRKEGLTHRQISAVMGKTEGYIKNLFMGINEIIEDKSLNNLISHAGVTIQDIVETKGIPDKTCRMKLLEERKQGYINRVELRRKTNILKAGNAGGMEAQDSPKEVPSGQVDPTVSFTLSPNGLTIKLTFNDISTAKLLETGIRRLLGRHQVKVT